MLLGFLVPLHKILKKHFIVLQNHGRKEEI